MAILVIAEHDNENLNAATGKAVMAAKDMGGDIHILVAGDGCAPVGDVAAKLEGVSKVLVAQAPHLKDRLAEEMQALIEQQMSSYDVVVAPATAMGKNVLPRLAAALDVMQISDIIKVVSNDTFERPVYAGNAIQTVKTSEAKKVITIRTSAFQSVQETGSAEINNIEAPGAVGKSTFESAELTKSDRPELASANVIISGGRGMQSGDNFEKLIEPVADVLGAAVGASRAAVDSGFVPNDMQVGQTGKVVAPDLYIAVGISGAIQHLAGMKDSKVIVAINKDAEAPIFQVADYGLVADLFTALPELKTELEKANG